MDGAMFGNLRLERDVSPGAWVVAAATGPWFTIGSLLPTTFPAYARLLHPAYQVVGESRRTVYDGSSRYTVTEPVLDEVRWRTIADANGRAWHPAIQWPSLTGGRGYVQAEPQPGLWEIEPEEGSLPRALAERLVDVLRLHTGTPERCWFAVWEGTGDLPFDERWPKLRMPNRGMFLLSGPIDEATTSLSADAGTFTDNRSASLWWPDDRAWCVATDIDLMCTFVASGERCIEAILRRTDLEALAVSVEHSTAWDSDTLNPVLDD